MPKTKGSDSSKPQVHAELKGKLAVRPISLLKPTPHEGKKEKTFECPLCVDVFKRFTQLKWHLLSMHPRRKLIMELVKERYGVSETDSKPVQSETFRNGDEEPCPCCSQTAEKSQPVMLEKGTAAELFKVPEVPVRFRQEATAGPQMEQGPCETSCKELAESSKAQDFVPKTSENEEGSSWDSYLSFCLTGCGSSEPTHGCH